MPTFFTEERDSLLCRSNRSKDINSFLLMDQEEKGSSDKEESEQEKHKRLHRLCCHCSRRRAKSSCGNCVFIGNYTHKEILSLFQDKDTFIVMERAFIPAFNWQMITKRKAVFKKKSKIKLNRL